MRPQINLLPQQHEHNGSANEAVNINRIEALKKLTRQLLREVQSLEAARTPYAKSSIRLSEEVQRFEVDLIRCALARTSGNQRRAAFLLGIKATTLNSKIKRYNILF
ncbi:MAG: Bacterial regulatory protein, Fis family [Blastocatellia bacterium]|jgi:transcriptional regulator with PAS, ATPase and Fis domain|nr:Bacterial regulatory protein, Fis family [Blastocatellia bacterium]